jgi:hypothetical protein
VEPHESRQLRTEEAQALSLARAKGVRFWLDNGQLRYSGPRDALSPDELSRLRSLREGIVALLERADQPVLVEADTALPPGPPRAPLTYSQLAHWNLHQLGNHSSRRETTAVFLLRGSLRIELLRQSIVEVIRRHDTLRTRIVMTALGPLQEMRSPCEYESMFEVARADLPPGPDFLARLGHLIEVFVMEPVEVSRDPLFATRLLRIRADQHVLILATEHMISDATSLTILTRDLFLAYTDLVNGRPVTWPQEAGSFAAYASRQSNIVPARIRRQGDWTAHLLARGRLRFPTSSTPDETRSGWTHITVRIPPATKAALQSWSRSHRTTLVMGVLTAYVAALLRWCNAPRGVIQYQWDGRISPRDDNVVGYFASMLYLFMDLEDGDSLLDLLHRAIQRYCDAYECADFGYIEAKMARPEVCRNTTFNWIPPVHELAIDTPDGELTCCPMDFTAFLTKSFARENEPMTVVHETNDEIAAHIYFPLERFSHAAMDRFGANFLSFVMALLERPETPVKTLAFQ